MQRAQTMFLGLALAVGCKRGVEVRPEPPGPTASASASVVASASASASAASSAPVSAAPPMRGECREGTYSATAVGAFSGSEFGGLGLSGAGEGGGKGEGIGLGSFGAGGGALGAVATTLFTGAFYLESGKVDLDKTGRAVCSAFAKLRPCFDGLQKAAPQLLGNTTLSIALAVDGTAGPITPSGGTLSDATLTSCLRTELLAVAFPKPEGGPAKLAYTFVYERRPKRAIKLTDTGTVVTGKLPPEVVKRIVRANYPGLRACYERGLDADPKLAGSVLVSFVIDATGAVDGVKEEPGTLADKKVAACVVGVFGAQLFPRPDSGTVAVKSGVDFKNEP